MKKKYDIEGMTCASCSSHIQNAISKLDGVNEVNVNLLTNSMDVVFDEEKIDDNLIINTVKKCGYKAKNNIVEKKITSKKIISQYDEIADNYKKRMIISIALLIPLMYVAMSHMYPIILPNFLKILIGANNNPIAFISIQLLLSFLVIIVNYQYFYVGFKTLFKLHPNMDSLIALGSSSAFIYGIYQFIKMIVFISTNQIENIHSILSNLYFESSSMILTFINIGKFLETKSKAKTSESITKLMELRPSTVIRINQNIEEEISIDDIKINDIILCKPGEYIGLDGIIIEGETSIDESSITGESIPVDKKIDDIVISGTINKYGLFKYRVTKEIKDSTLEKIIQLVVDSSSSKAPIAKLADKISLVFVPCVLAISIITFVGWIIISKNVDIAFNNAITVLVISCPCALGLATPLSIMVGSSLGARNGILFKKGEAIESLAKVDTILFDKTGTITKGEMEVTHIENYSNLELMDIYNILYSIEKYSTHPLATSICKYLEKKHNSDVNVIDVQQIIGKGIKGKIDNKEIYCGNKVFLEEITHEKIEDASLGYTSMYLFDDKLIARIELLDQIKESSIDAITKINKLGIRTIMATGDNLESAKIIQSKVKIDTLYASCLPQDKARIIKEEKSKSHHVAMVGDGINDAPSLALADVSLSMGEGSDIALESSDIVLMKNDINSVYKAIILSRVIIKNIKENLFWALIYNCILIPLAAGVLYNYVKMNPMYGSIAMIFSSLFVCLNALRLNLFKFKERKEEIKMNKYIVTIEGMMCQHCVKHVKDALVKVNGVLDVDVSLENKNAIVISNKALEENEIKQLIEEEGYKVIKIEAKN